MRRATEPKHGAVPTKLMTKISTRSLRKRRVSSTNISHPSVMKISSSLSIPPPVDPAAWRRVIVEKRNPEQRKLFYKQIAC
jgi:hypothetical protein